MSTVVCTSVVPVDLSDGRTLGPGEEAVDVDTSHPHHRNLVLDGHLLVTEGSVPRTRPSEEDLMKALASDAAAAADDGTATAPTPAKKESRR